MITHVVLFWLKDPQSTADRAELIAGIRGLAAIEVVRSLHVGFPAETEVRGPVDHSFSVSEILTFATVADEAIYQDHPLHQRFIATCGSLWDRVVVYDIADA
jgi:hypothetical protein